MNSQKLFRILVIGGTLIGGNSMGGQAQNDLQNFGALTSEAQQSPSDEPAQCFCNTDKDRCCEVNSCGESVAKDGFICCWGTSCKDN